MNLFTLNLLLGLGLSVLLAQYTLAGFLFGFALAYAALWVTQPLYGPTRYFQRLPRAISLVGFFFWQLLKSNFRVLWDVVTPSHISRPGIIGIPLEAKTDLEIMMVANLISLTPGTLSIDLSEDRRTLFVHFMFLEDPDTAREEIKDGFERRVLEVFR